MKFKFKSFDKQGNYKSGTIDASSKRGAIIALQNQGLVVTNIIPAEFRIRLSFLERIKLKELAFFTRELHFLIKARIPLDDSIQTLHEQTTNRKLKRILEELYDDVVAGVSLSKALSKHSDVFNSYYVKMVQIGEVSGSLDEVTDYLATNIENQNKFFSKLIQSLIYPAIVVVVFFITMIIIFTTVIPRITEIFVANKIPMPLLTRIFAGFSYFLMHNWIYLSIVSAILIALAITFVRKRKGKLFFLKLLAKIPIINTTIQITYLLRFLDSFSFLVKGGLPIAESLSIVAGSINNPVFEDALKFVAEETKKGRPISSALRFFPRLFPPLVVQSFVTGEKTGKLREILFSIASFYGQELELRTATFSESIQPIILIFLAVGLGFLEASLLIPLMSLTNSVSSF